MAAFRSRPDGGRTPGWRGWALGLLAAWLVPPLLGLAVLALAGLAERLLGPGRAPAGLGGGAWLMALSLMLSWLWLAPLALAAWLLRRLGAGGWASLALAGAAAGALGVTAVPGMPWAAGLMLGALTGLILGLALSLPPPGAR